MLHFIFQLSEVLNDGLAFFALLFVRHIAHGTMEVIDGTGLLQKPTYQHENSQRNSRKAYLPESQATYHGQKRSQSSTCRR